MQDKCYFNSLHIWGEVACPDLILRKYQNKESDKCQNKESDSRLSLSLWSLPPLYDSPIKQTNKSSLLKELTHIVVNSDKSKV